MRRNCFLEYPGVKTITVSVKEDHLESLAKTRPMTALAELIWNALDAESTEVRVDFVENELEGLEQIRITDDGNGLHYDDAMIVFQNLGGSWKRQGMRTHQRKRMLHGKYGKGRFRAFSLGNNVRWRSVYEEAGSIYGFEIRGQAAKLGEFTLTDARGCPRKKPGMVVDITDLPPNAELLRGVKAQQEVTDIFALYLRQYPDIRILYDGVPIDPANAEEQINEYDLGEMILENGERVTAQLTVIEWNLPGKRGVYLCNEDGFMLYNALPRLHFRGFSYTAYLKSEHIAFLDREGLLSVSELHPDLRQMLDVARSHLREHFALREAEKAQDVLEQWHALGLYPYKGAPKDEVEANERRIFEIYATHLNQIFPDFSRSTHSTRRLMLKLIQELVHIEPTRVAHVLDTLLDFPEDKEEAIQDIMQS